MSLLNLSIAEFAALFGAVSAVLVTLYLLDRSRRKVIAASLRFWKPAGSVPQQTQKRRIQQPWSLVLQLLSIALLLLAVAQMQWGSRGRGRDHVLLLDTSAWMNARTPSGTLMDDARSAALGWLDSLPSADRVLVVRADGLATPAGSLESDRAKIDRTIRDSAAGSSALNLHQALEFARQIQRVHSSNPGEIVYAGAGRIASGEPVGAPPPSLRVLSVGGAVQNAGLRKLGLKRSESEPFAWDVFVEVRNYGDSTVVAPVELRFGGALVGARTLPLEPGADKGVTFTLRTRAAGLLEARLAAADPLPEDNRAAVEIPAQQPLRVIVFTAEPESLRPVLSAASLVSAEFRQPSPGANPAGADVVIYDGFAPATPPSIPSVWIDPPEQGAPFRIKSRVEKARLVWNGGHELGSGIRTRDLEVTSSSVFQSTGDDIAIAATGDGPAIIAREEKPGRARAVAFGFHPVRAGMRYELATPIVFANVLRWLHPEVFRRWELNAGPVGAVTAALEDEAPNAEPVTVRADGGHAVPYTVEAGQVRFFSGVPGNVRVLRGDREIVFSLTLPDVADAVWTVPAGVRQGVPRRAGFDPAPRDLWPWLALAGAAGLALEWSLWGRGQRRRSPSRGVAQNGKHHWWRRKAS